MKSQSETKPSSDGVQKPGEAASAGANARGLTGLDSAILKEVQVDLKARLGQASLSVEDLLALKPGSVVKLESKLNDLVELRLNSTAVAFGEIVAVGEHFGVRIVSVAKTA